MDDARFPMEPPDPAWEANNPDWHDVPPNDPRWRADRKDKDGNLKPPKAEPLDPLGIWDAGDDDYQIPPRGWLLGTTFCRRFLSSLIADGGVGKTALRVAQLISLAIGRSLTGEHVFQRVGQVEEVLALIDVQPGVAAGVLGQARAALGKVEEVITTEALSRLYGTPIDVLHVDGRMVVVSGHGAVEADAHRHDA